MYIERSSDLSGDENVFVSFERTAIFQIRHFTFHLNPFSISGSDSINPMRRFSNQLLSSESIWSKRFIIPKNDKYGKSLTQWTLVSLKFIIEIYGFKLICDQIHTTPVALCIVNLSKTHAVY